MSLVTSVLGFLAGRKGGGEGREGVRVAMFCLLVVCSVEAAYDHCTKYVFLCRHGCTTILWVDNTFCFVFFFADGCLGVDEALQLAASLLMQRGRLFWGGGGGMRCACWGGAGVVIAWLGRVSDSSVQGAKAQLNDGSRAKTKNCTAT